MKKVKYTLKPLLHQIGTAKPTSNEALDYYKKEGMFTFVWHCLFNRVKWCH